MADYRPIPTPRRQRMDDLRRRALPLLVWVVAAIAGLFLLTDQQSRREYIGLAQAFEYPVSAPTTGTVSAMPVDLFDSVAAGDVVARLDDGLLRAQIDTARATIQQLEAQLAAARTQIDAGGTTSDYRDDLRRFQINEEERRLEIMGLRVTIESDVIESERLKLEMGRFERLRGDGLVSQQIYDNTRMTLAMVEQRLGDNRVLLEQAETQYGAAQARRIEFESQLGRKDWQLAPLVEAISVEDARLREIETLRAGLLLRSPISGQISQIWAREGQAVTPGDPVVTVTDPQVGEIVAFIAEHDPRVPRPSNPVLVSNLRDPDRVGESIVIAVSPNVQLLPEQLWARPQVPIFGRAVRISPLPALALTPGERVRVRFVD